MSSNEGPRHRFPEKQNDEADVRRGEQKILTEEEATKKASNRWISHFLIAFCLSLATPLVVIILLPSPVKPRDYPHLSQPKPFRGPLAYNNDLARAEKIYNGQLEGPESLVVDGDRIYTGTANGWVNILFEGKVKPLVHFGQEPCGGIENENSCGRPLGMRMTLAGILIVCDAYHGLFEVNVTTGNFVTLYKASTPVNGEPSKFLNDLDIDGQGRIFFTDSSTRWHRNQFVNLIMEGDTSGRVLMYDPDTKTTEQVMGGLMFPNGVQITGDKSSVLVAELCRARILKYNLATKEVSIWADGFPGHPDNIRLDELSGTYWVGMGMVRYVDQFSLLDFLAYKPWLRGILAKIVDVSSIQTVRSMLRQVSTPRPQALAVEMDQDGNIVSSLQDSSGSAVTSVSEVFVAGSTVYLGSFHNEFIARLDTKTNKPD